MKIKLLQTMRLQSGFQIAPNLSYIGKMTMTWQFVNMTSSSIFCDIVFVSLVLFSYCFKFDVNIITGSGVMTVFFCKGLTSNWEIQNTLVWVLHNTRRLGRVRNTKFGMNISDKMLLNASKWQGYSQGYSFYIFLSY